MKRIITEHTVRSPRIPEHVRFAVASDIHSTPYDDVLDTFAQCDAVLVPGDLVDRHRRDNSDAYRFLQEVPEIVPVFLSPGNHEVKYRHAEEFLARPEYASEPEFRPLLQRVRALFAAESDIFN